ncbi:hypothetical protein SPRG_16308 [Saprolegnia parasitica CBS 223.65]|uniref:BZIP domain-containing protein n=1 Tax=Saprolegnia parasitica (strain CBS 223.65) TaxID=695850 RepID=A0A067BII7_SAPPC|nr:hypothetical protein SPRG_16308 [Saprolegnia parasitica CBS 223.65]KDO18184.1 hypothetical protein SPRG_16308 [Saprolegnia parasitica CBS 223.65]|eukprot:XP_012211111.1 hypothetical protein SPRG_16308 [Saprolegnia parasitica CBS 223.65]
MNLASLLSHDDDRQYDDESDDGEVRAAQQHSEANDEGDTPSPTTTESSSSPIDYFRPGAAHTIDEKKNRHRLSNMRHRKRKNMEIDGLRRRARDLEVKRDQLQAASTSIAASEGPWEELCEIERGKLALAREEQTVLARSVARHEVIIQKFYTNKYPGQGDDDETDAQQQQQHDEEE